MDKERRKGGEDHACLSSKQPWGSFSIGSTLISRQQLRGTRKPGTVDYPTHSTALWEILDDLRNGKETKRMASNEAMQLCQAEADVRGIANVLWKQVTAVYRDTSYR